MKTNTIGGYCSWQGHQPPTIEFCEARTCGLVAEPANAWSNLAYVIVGIYLLAQTRKPEIRNLWPGAVTAILVGICSFAFHAYPTFNTEYLDLFSMYLFGTYLFSINLYRAFNLSRNQTIGIYCTTLIVSAVLLLVQNELGILAFAIQISSALVLELWIFVYRPETRDYMEYRYFWAIIICMSTALTIWTLDLYHVVCDSDNHLFQGHALWHVLTAVCFLFIFAYGRQFKWAGISTE